MWFWCENIWCYGFMVTQAEAEAARIKETQISKVLPILWMKRPKGIPCQKRTPDAEGCSIEARTAPAPVAIMQPEDMWLLLTEDQKARSAKGESVALSADRVGPRAWDIATRRRTASGSQEDKYLPCNTGSETLRQIDTWERQGLAADVRDSGQRIPPETFAEKLIGDCSQQLAVMSAAAGLDKDSPLRAVVNAWQTNLDFMKWWLQNRRSKTQKP